MKNTISKAWNLPGKVSEAIKEDIRLFNEEERHAANKLQKSAELEPKVKPSSSVLLANYRLIQQVALYELMGETEELRSVKMSELLTRMFNKVGLVWEPEVSQKRQEKAHFEAVERYRRAEGGRKT